MAAITVEDHVDSLLTQQVAEAKTGGVPNAAVEANAVFNSIALNLILKPRAALYFSVLARNGLQKAVQDEINALSTIKRDVQDLGNVSFRIQGSATLRRARSALLALEKLPRVSATNPTLQLFQSSVNEFLNSQLSKNVRRAGSSDLIRPSNEAKLDLVNDVQALKDLHMVLLRKLYSLAVGIENFVSAPFAALIGTSTVSRARSDLEDILAQVEASGDPSPARDYAIRLLSNQAAISTIATPPSPFDPLLAANATGKSGPASATSLSAVGPFSLGTSPVFAVTVNGKSESFNFFSGAGAVLLSAPIVFPITIPAGYGLFFSVDGTAHRVAVAGTFANAAALAAALGGQSWVSAYQFANDSTRLLLVFPGANSATVQPIYTYPTPDPQTTTGVLSTTALSAHAYCGLGVGQVASRSVTSQMAADAVNSLFTLVSAQVTADGRVQLFTSATAPGTSLAVSAPSSFAFAGAAALSDQLVLDGVVDHRVVVQVGDQIRLGNQLYLVDSVVEEAISFSSPVSTYVGPVSATSSLVVAYQTFIAKLKVFLRRWNSLPYVSNINTLDRVFAPLGASPTPGQRNMAVSEVQRLSDELSSLLNLLTDQSTMLPDGAAQEERDIVEGILTTLQERHYDRAADLLLECNIQALMEMDADQASYGGNFMKAASTFAQANFKNEDPEASDSPSAISAGHT